MPEPAQPAQGEKPPAATSVTRRRPNRKILLCAVPVILLGAAGASWLFVPGVKTTVQAFLKPAPAASTAAVAQPAFINLPEMTVTLPNGGQPRQMRIKLSLEVVSHGEATPAAEVLSPRVYDALLTYLRTLHDSELQGGLALDRIREDLYRRLDLVLGTGVLRDVLITGLVVG